MLIRFARSEQIVCEHEEAALSALRHRGNLSLDFVDGYLAARTAKDRELPVLTNDRAIRNHIGSRTVDW